MAERPHRTMTASDAVTAYKQMLAEIIDRRPSGTRQRLATALSKNRSFVSQITNPLYATPVPASHLDVIFEICHFSSTERRDFIRLYAIAHPKRAVPESEKRSVLAVHLPDLGDDARNRKLHSLVSGFVRQIVKLIDEETPGKHGRR
jgi:hypothetical protein